MNRPSKPSRPTHRHSVWPPPEPKPPHIHDHHALTKKRDIYWPNGTSASPVQEATKTNIHRHSSPFIAFHRFIVSSLHRLIASSSHRFIASSSHRFIAKRAQPPATPFSNLKSSVPSPQSQVLSPKSSILFFNRGGNGQRTRRSGCRRSCTRRRRCSTGSGSTRSTYRPP